VTRLPSPGEAAAAGGSERGGILTGHRRGGARRALPRLLGAVAATAALVASTAPAGVRAAGATPPVIRVGSEGGGTLTWALYVMQKLGLDRRYGVAVQPVPFATKDAARMALRGGAVDIKVDDWLYVSVARAEGLRIQAVDAYSRAVGGIVVRADTPVRSIADLRGRRIGVTSLADKSYLILRAVAVSRFGFDPQRDSQVITAAPPLLNQLLARKDVDAIVQYWHFVAQLVATPQYRELSSTLALLRRLEPGVDLPFLVVAATDEAVRTEPRGLRGFLAALRDSQAQLASRADLWADLWSQNLLGVADRSALPAIQERYRLGLPGPWTRATVTGLLRLTATLAGIAGSETLGIARLDPAAYNITLVRPQ
jgi:NitT/TauT family transport system substrate-binding protein